MASDQKLDSFLTWGDDAQIIQSAPQQYHPGSIGSVCGIHVIISSDVAKQFCQKIGSKLYSIEFDNGETIEVPESFLIKMKIE